MNNDQVNFATIDEAIGEYVKIRDELREKMQEFGAIEKAYKDYLEKISMWLLDKGDELGVDNFKTESGTAFRNVKVQYRVGSWDQFVEWVQQSGNFQCLEKRVAKNATKEIHDESGLVPPGIEYVAEVEFDVRRPNKRGDKSK